LVRIGEAVAELDRRDERERAELVERAARRADRVAGSGSGRVPGKPQAGSEVVLAEEALAIARSKAAGRLQEWQTTGRGARPPEVAEQWLVRKETARLVRAHQIVAAREARRPRREPVRNITDPQSRPQPKADGGWVQGYNAQAVTTGDGLIFATDVSNNPSDAPTFVPMMDLLTATAEKVGAGPVGLILADAGYLSVDNLTAAGPDRLIAVGSRRQLMAAAAARADQPETDQPETDPPGTEPPGDAPPLASGGRDPAITAMTDRLATPDGMAAYRQRSQIAETTFGHAKHNLAFRRFTGTGLDRARAEWKFHAAVHNIFKIITHGMTPIQPTG
jgi:hypothetical protein